MSCMTDGFHTTGWWGQTTHSNAPLVSRPINCIPNISIKAILIIIISIYHIVDLFMITVMAMNSINLHTKLADEENLMV